MDNIKSNNEFREDVALTYFSELDRQSRKINLFAFLISFTWLLYIPIDMKLNINYSLIVSLRLGLVAVGFLNFIIINFSTIKYRNLIALVFYGTYLEIATGIITGLTGGNPAYIGGFLFILMLLSIVPIPQFISWTLLYVSYSIFLLIFLIGKHKIDDTLAYSLRDSVNVVIVDTVFIFISNRLRYLSWKKSTIIEKERERSNDLLLNILPNPIALELQENGFVKPLFHKSATVVFTDFVGFSWISEILDPETLISKLDRMFREFDLIIEKYKLEKLKTIGDSYMYAGGLPSDNNTHAIDSVLAALEIVRFVHHENELIRGQTAPTWEIRVGVHTGGVMAGVVGQKKFIYDIWGDSVNIASRLESSGVKGMVNISSETYQLVKDFFDVENRGMISAKNKGEIDMFLIRGIKKELSIDGYGIEPNDVFCDKYCKIKES